MNLEDVIKESIIEGSNISAVGESLNDGINADLNNRLYDKSLSLDVNSGHNEKILDSIRNENNDEVDENELEKLCEISGAIFINKDEKKE